MKERKILAGFTALILCMIIPLAACGEVKFRNIEEKGKIKETVWTDENGQPAAGPEGYASVRYTYTRDTTTERYYDTAGNPYRTDGGYYGRVVTKDGKNRIFEQLHLLLLAANRGLQIEISPSSPAASA